MRTSADEHLIVKYLYIQALGFLLVGHLKFGIHDFPERGIMEIMESFFHIMLDRPFQILMPMPAKHKYMLVRLQNCPEFFSPD
jgi:hypothetical protein